jgi:bifunctional non-homologous end joining protein LigD
VSLREYRSKRRFSDTPEPAGARAKSSAPLRFVVQKHDARRLHFDFRLEAEGVLKSWAIPKGPSLDPEVKRLAVMVEDHPLQYGDFEGVIPRGNYGAGTVMVWDAGTYSMPGITERAAIEAAVLAGLSKGRMHIILHGNKLRGEFALFRIRSTDSKNWLLRKIADQYVVGGGAGDDDRSVQSERSLAEITTGSAGSQPKAKINLRGIPRGPMPRQIKPMLATATTAPFDRAGWLFEVKWDGYRALAEVEGETVRLYSRRGLSYTKRYPAIAAALAQLGHDAVLDGEIVVVDEQGKSQFQLLQDYANSRSGNLLYYVFDLLYLDGHDLKDIPLLRRKEILAQIIRHLPNVRLSEHIEEHGQAFFRAVADKQLEGMVAKDGQSAYRPGLRAQSWIKIKTHRRQEAVIGGFTKPRGGRSHFGALVLGVYKGQDLIYIGRVGTGFSESTLKSLYSLLEPRIQTACPFTKRPKTDSPARWVRPELVCEVSFQEWSRDGHIIRPVFEGLREDLLAREVHRNAEEEAPPPAPANTGAARSTGRRAGKEQITLDGHLVQLTNQNKVYWPADGYTKGDLIDYYRQVAPVILPYLVDRPESLNRHPGGIEGKNFFQKNITPQKPPAWLPTATVKEEARSTPSLSVLCQNQATLVYLANLGCIELNPWHSRIQSLDRPDYLMLDLDPEAIDFVRVIETARVVHRILDRIDAPSCCKTSGKRGLHIYVPLGAKYAHDQAKQFAELIAMAVHRELPATTSLERSPAARQQRVYLDYLQNGRGKTLAAAYCVRPKQGATVSTPLQWSEVKAGLDPGAYTIRTMPRRLEKVGDLWRSTLGPGMDLPHSLGKMAALLGSKSQKAH